MNRKKSLQWCEIAASMATDPWRRPSAATCRYMEHQNIRPEMTKRAARLARVRAPDDPPSYVDDVSPRTVTDPYDLYFSPVSQGQSR